MGRIYTVNFAAVTVSAAQDLVFIPGITAKGLIIRRFWLGCPDTTLATGQGLSLRCRLLPATVTPGTGGTTGITPSKTDQGDAASSIATAGTNNTSKATTSGTAVVLYANGVHLFQGENRIVAWPVASTAAFVFELLSTVSGTVTLSGGVEIEEIG